jgi:hypothetical protein
MSFWQGVFETGTDLIKEDEDRNYKLIDSAIGYQAKNIAANRTEREGKQQAFNVLAVNLADMEGMTDSKINLVLSKGLKKATEFLDQVGPDAKKRGLTPGEYVDLMDEDSPEVTPKELIKKGKLVDMPSIGTFNQPAGLNKSYQKIFERQSDFMADTMGLTDTTENTITAPEGKILWDIMGGSTGADYRDQPYSQVRKAWLDTKSSQMGIEGSWDGFGNFKSSLETQQLDQYLKSNMPLFDRAFDMATKYYDGKSDIQPWQVVEQATTYYNDLVRNKKGVTKEELEALQITVKKTEEPGIDGGKVVKRAEENKMQALIEAPSAAGLIQYLREKEGLDENASKEKAGKLRQEHKNNENLKRSSDTKIQ